MGLCTLRKNSVIYEDWAFPGAGRSSESENVSQSQWTINYMLTMSGLEKFRSIICIF